MNAGTVFAHIPEGYTKTETGGFLQRFLEPVVGEWLYVDSGIWTVIGFLGAGIFGSRFFLQWLQSEKERRLVVPWYFWHLSFWGSSLNMIYFLHLDKAPLILGNCFLPILYARNLVLLHRGGHTTLRSAPAGESSDAEKKADEQSGPDGSDPEKDG